MKPVPVHHTFGPMALPSQIHRALLLQLMPWKWKNGKEKNMLSQELSDAFGKQAFLFDSGRGALLALLKSMNIGPGHEVIVQAFTCIAVPNAVSATGAVPVFADVASDSLNIDPAKVRKLMTERTKAVVCQHTFGSIADVQELRKICDEHNALLIEDCAHVLSRDKKTTIGTFSDALILSFGRDKAISGVAGGAVLTDDKPLCDKLEEMEKDAQSLSLWSIMNLINYPLRYKFAKSIWRNNLGKAYLLFLKNVGWMPRIYTSDEKKGYASPVLHSIPNACALLALDQWRRLSSINAHRRKIRDMYATAADKNGWNYVHDILRSPAPQKFTLLHPDAKAVRNELRKKHIHLNDGWTGGAINPDSVDGEHIGYAEGTCPQAEALKNSVLTLPCHPTTSERQVEFLIKELRPLL